jgi:hypothetical protein
MHIYEQPIVCVRAYMDFFIINVCVKLHVYSQMTVTKYTCS